MKLAFPSALVLLLGSMFSSAQAASPEVAEGLRLLEEGRTTLAEPALNEAWNYFDKLNHKSPASTAVLYNLARIDYYRCNAAAARDDKKTASAAIDRAIEKAQQAVHLDDRSADARALLGTLYGRKIGLGGFMSGPRLGPKAAAENKRALELDPDNPRVQASLGRQYLEAPKMFGGDVDQAIASFRKSVQLEPTNDETYVWLALAYRKKGDSAQADQAIDKALQLNPQSVFAQSVKSGKVSLRLVDFRLLFTG